MREASRDLGRFIPITIIQNCFSRVRFSYLRFSPLPVVEATPIPLCYRSATAATLQLQVSIPRQIKHLGIHILAYQGLVGRDHSLEHHSRQSLAYSAKTSRFVR